jgi:hypothetical protein
LQNQSSKDFTPVADSPRRSYVALIARIEKQLSDFPLTALTDRRTRGIFSSCGAIAPCPFGHGSACNAIA